MERIKIEKITPYLETLKVVWHNHKIIRTKFFMKQTLKRLYSIGDYANVYCKPLFIDQLGNYYKILSSKKIIIYYVSIYANISQ